MSLEYFIIEYHIEKQSILNKQIKFHHAVILSVYLLSLFAGYGLPGCACAILLGEFSSMFLSYKSMFSKESRNKQIAKVNLICFFLAFTLFRIVFYPYLVYRTFIQILLTVRVVSFM